MTKYTLPSSRFPVPGLLCVLCVLLLSCGDGNTGPADTTVSTSSQSKPHEIPFTVDLLPGYQVVQEFNMVGWTYYFRYEGKESETQDAGIFFGTMPDTTSPSYYGSKRDYTDSLLGDPAAWREFRTTRFIMRDVLVETSNGEYANAWCYSADSVVVEQLTTMIRTIRKK